MRFRVVCAAVGGGALLVLSAASASAQCTKDTDCKGERVCEAGKCTLPTPTQDPAAAPAVVAPTVAADAPQPAGGEAPAVAPAPEPPPAAPAAAPAGPSATATAAAATTSAPLSAVEPLPEEPKLVRKSKPVMVMGIIFASIAPVALLGAVAARNSQIDCDDALERKYPDHIVPAYDRFEVERCDDYTTSMYTLGIAGGVLLAAGVPMIFYGARMVPNPAAGTAPRASLTPWATPQSGGLRLRLTL